MPSSAASTNQQIPTPTSAAPNVQQWSPYDGSTSEAAGSNNFFTQQYQFGQDSAQTTGNPTMAGMMPTTTTQTEYGGLMPEFEFPMLFDTTALFSMGEMLPDELFSLPIDGNGNFYAPWTSRRGRGVGLISLLWIFILFRDAYVLLDSDYKRFAKIPVGSCWFGFVWVHKTTFFSFFFYIDTGTPLCQVQDTPFLVLYIRYTWLLVFNCQYENPGIYLA